MMQLIAHNFANLFFKTKSTNLCLEPCQHSTVTDFFKSFGVENLEN